ncbi:MAG TPA: adenosylcobinamide-phosphate synthase CbiB [Novosphingobium sp.]|nr:adenosylcobinamide-phosphate synthase CbiB [Novosphingobium sp.]
MLSALAFHAAALLVALALDALLGWPAWLYARIGHPVSWLGRLIAAADCACNREGAAFALRRAAGVAVALGVIGLAAGAGWGLAGLVAGLVPAGWPGVVLLGALCWPLLAAGSLHAHVAAVARPLAAGDMAGARQAVAMIVGRDPDRLDAAGIARAAAESLAENTSDGVIAPLFWGLLFGLPGIAGYKAVNTLDSMIAYRTTRHRAFGWAAARIDDAANLLPARLTGLFYALASGRPWAALRCMAADARHHRSPNAGWPEAAMAGALGIRLSGPRLYAEGMSQDRWLNGAAPDPVAADLAAALALFGRVVGLAALGLALLAVGVGGI